MQLENQNLNKEIKIVLLNHVFKQSPIALISTIILSTLMFFGIKTIAIELFNWVYLWFTASIIITLIRLILLISYQNKRSNNVTLWRTLFIFSTLLGGLAWGMLGFFIPHATLAQQNLIVIVIAGVTAGSIPFSAAIPKASICFLTSALLPLIFVVGKSTFYEYVLVEIALIVYLIYCIMLTWRTYSLLKTTTELKFRNDYLLNNLICAKEELERANITLNLTATHDPLTNAGNRRLFESTLTRLMSEATHSDKIYLLYLDLDKFKPINDNYGHHIGDEVLKIVTYKIHSCVDEKQGLIFRLGGDEFTVLLCNLSVNDLSQVISDIEFTISSDIIIGSHSISINVSIGVSVYPEDGLDIDSLLKVADMRMYNEKVKHKKNYTDEPIKI